MKFTKWSLFPISSIILTAPLMVSLSTSSNTTTNQYVSGYEYLNKTNLDSKNIKYRLFSDQLSEIENINYHDIRIKNNQYLSGKTHAQAITIGRSQHFNSKNTWMDKNWLTSKTPTLNISYFPNNNNGQLKLNIKYPNGISAIQDSNYIGISNKKFFENYAINYSMIYSSGSTYLTFKNGNENETLNKLLRKYESGFNNGRYVKYSSVTTKNYESNNFDEVVKNAIAKSQNKAPDPAKNYWEPSGFKEVGDVVLLPERYNNDSQYIAYVDKFNIQFKNVANVLFQKTTFKDENKITITRLMDALMLSKEMLNESRINIDLKTILNNSSSVNISSDTMGNLITQLDASVFKGGTSNKDKLNQLFNQTFTYTQNNLEMQYQYVPIISSENTINISVRLLSFKDLTNQFDYLKLLNQYQNKANNFINDLKSTLNLDIDEETNWRQLLGLILDLQKPNQVLVKRGVNVYLSESEIYKKYSSASLKAKLNITFSKVPNNLKLADTYPNMRHDLLFSFDTPIRLNNDDKEDVGKEWYGGKWLVHGALNITFNADLDENEVLTINGEKVEVLNRVFNKELIDRRLKTNEESDDKSEIKKPLNEYVIEIKQYPKGSNNSGEEIKKWKVIYVVVEKPVEQKFIYYAWDPENNPSQKELITEFLLDEKGNFKLDKNGQKIPNEKYDPAIDKETGTKKQIVWINNSTLSNNIKQHLSFIYPNLPNNQLISDFGIFAEATVLGSGALRNVIVDENLLQSQGINKIKYYRAKIGNFKKDLNNNNILEWNNNPTISELSITNGESEFAYMSEEGLWLVFTDIENTITNAQLVLINKDNSPKNFFMDEISNINDDQGISLKDKFSLFFNENNLLAKSFKQYLFIVDGLNDEQVNKLNYQVLLEKYVRFVSWSQLYGYDTDVNPELRNLDLFNMIKWNEISNLNGLTNKEKIKEIILNYIKQHLYNANFLKQYFNVYDDTNWIIKEWSDTNLEQNWLNQASKVVLYSDEDFNNYQGLTFTLQGMGKIANQSKTFVIKNTAFHIYEPPIDLRTLNINKEFKINISKQDFEDNSLTLDEIDNKYREAITNEVKSLISQELESYRVKSLELGREIEIWLDKDIEISNLNEAITLLMRGNKLNKKVNVVLKGINANLLNEINLTFINEGDGGRFNLNNITYDMMSKNLIMSETNPNKISQNVKEYAKSILNKLNLIQGEDYNIYSLDNSIYWFELVMAYDDPKIDLDPEFKADLMLGLEKLNKYTSMEHNNKRIDIPFEPTINLLNAKFHEYYKYLLETIQIDVHNAYKNEIVRNKTIVIVPTEKSEGFAHGMAFNKVNKEYDPTKDNEWKDKINEDSKNDDLENKDKQDNNKEKEKDKEAEKEKQREKNKILKRNILISIFSLLGGIGVIVLIVFGVKFYGSKYGYKFGKRVKNKNKVKTLKDKKAEEKLQKKELIKRKKVKK